MIIRRILMLAGIYLMFGCVITVLAYLATGVPRFESDFPVHAEKLELIPILMRDFIILRFPVAVLEAIVLSWLIIFSERKNLLIAVAIGLPVTMELFFLSPLHGTWVGDLWGVVINWPARPEYLMPLGLILRTGATCLTPPTLAGLGSAMILTLLEARRHRADHCDES